MFCEYKNHWFVWEPAWESFRPITSFSWDGTGYVLNDWVYCSDPFDPLYGYGSPQMKQVCEAVTSQFASQVPSAPSVRSLAIGSSEWMYDRMVSLTPCAPRDRHSWKQMTHGRIRTLRNGPRNKLTRRTLTHTQ